MDNAFTTFEVEVKGVAPMLLHNGNMANPFNPHVKAMKELQANAKRNKTDEFYFQLSKLEWYAGLYLNSKKEPIIPQDVLIACMVKAGKRQRKGDIVKSCIFIELLAIPCGGVTTSLCVSYCFIMTFSPGLR